MPDAGKNQCYSQHSWQMRERDKERLKLIIGPAKCIRTFHAVIKQTSSHFSNTHAKIQFLFFEYCSVHYSAEGKLLIFSVGLRTCVITFYKYSDYEN